MYVQDVRAVRRMGQGLSEQVAVHMCGFDGIQRGNYFGGEPIRTEVKKVIKEKTDENALPWRGLDI